MQHEVRKISPRQITALPAMLYVMIRPYLRFHRLQHHSMSFSMALCCCPMYGLGFMSAISLLMIVLHGAISIAIILSVALLVSQETPPALMEPAAPPTAMSSSPRGFLSLSIWMFFESLQPLPCFLLATFWNASSCPHCSNSKKSLQLSLLPLHMMASKHGEVASLEGILFAEAG